MSRAAVAAMTAYALELREAEIKLNQNESAYDLPPALKDELLRRVVNRPWNRYPDFELTELREALAAANDLDVANILVGNGSNELLAAAVATFVGPGTPVVVARPSFALYEKMVAIAGGAVVPVSVDPRSGFLPLDAMLAAATPDSVVIVCSPNNPTGGVLPPGGLEALLATGATVFLDRAYGDFDESASSPGGAPPRNLVTFSTFSKAWGLAALRVGWLAAAEETCREIRKVKLPYSLNIVSEAAAILALENRALRDANVARVKSERSRVAAALRAIPGIEVFPSQANFIMFAGAARIFDDLLARGILIRKYADCLRVTIGSTEENDSFLAAMKEIA